MAAHGTPGKNPRENAKLWTLIDITAWSLILLQLLMRHQRIGGFFTGYGTDLLHNASPTVSVWRKSA